MGIKDTLSHLKGFLGSPPIDYVQNSRDFLRVDVDEMVRKGKYIKRGEERGSQNLPPSDATQLDEVEREIKTRFEGDIAENHEILGEEISAFTSRVGSLQLNKVPNLQVEINTATGEFKEEIANGLNAARLTRRKVIEINEAMDEFKRVNRRVDPAMYPDSKLLHIAFILLLLLVESVLNGNMLGLGAEGGLIQGLFIAFTIAVINVGLLGFFLGKTLRYCHHVALPKKLFAGVIPTAAIVLILIGLNFMVAHYRDVLQSVDIALDNVGIAVMDRVWSLMPPADAQSVLLFLVGLLFGILAGIDWLKMDDRYPGYGERARRQDLEEENYAEEVRETLQRLGDLHSETADILLDLKENLEHKETEFKSILSHRERKVGQFKATEAHNLSAAHQVVEKYRDSNRNARSTPAPDYFTRDLEVVTQPIETSRAGEMSIAQVESEIKRVVEKLESGITEIHESWGKAQEEFKKTHQLARERINVEG